MEDSLRAVLDSVFAAPAYQWEEPSQPFAFLGRWLGWVVEQIVRWGRDNPTALKVLFWAGVALLALVLIRAAWRIYAGFRRSADPRAPAAAAVPRDAQWYRKEADRLHREGRWLEAMQADFTALIFLLERRQIVRYHPSKTPREYAREAALPEGPRAELGDLVWSLYRHLFGHEPVTAAAALAWRERTADDRYAAA